jgi:hypothetical protein
LLCKENCDALNKLISYDNEQSSPLGTIFSKDYHALSFTNNMLGLNADFPSIAGKVDIDWMLRSAAGGLGVIPGLSHATYWSGKSIWNAARGKNPLENISQEGNKNAPNAARYWLESGISLENLFGPALKECNIKK